MTRSKAIFLILTGAFFMSFAALLVVLIQNADGFQILAFRSIPQFIVVLIFACFLKKLTPLEFIKSLDRIDVFIGVAMAAAFIFYVFALLYTSVASAMFILSIAPVFAALLNWIFFKERPNLIVWVCILTALLGVSIMVSGSTELGQTSGNVFAIISALAFAIMLVTARNSGKTHVLGGNFLGAFFAALIMGVTAFFLSDTGLVLSQYDLLVSLACGAFTIGIGIVCISLAAPHLPPPEVSIIILFESVMSPIWVWIFLGQAITTREIIGGLIVLSAVILLSLKGRERLRK